MLEIIEKPQNSLTYVSGIWLATQKVIRRDFDPARAHRAGHAQGWRRDPGQASVDLAELVANTRRVPQDPRRRGPDAHPG